MKLTQIQFGTTFNFFHQQREGPRRAEIASQSPSRPMFGLQFSCESIDDIAREICTSPVPNGAGIRLLATLNVDHVVNLRRNADFRQAYRSAWKVTIDGMPILIYARLRRIGTKSRVTGASLFPVVFDGLKPGVHRPFFVPSNQITANILRERLLAAGFDDAQIGIRVPEFGFEADPVASLALEHQIAALRPTHIFFGVGAPKSEIWIDRHRAVLGDAYGLAVGAALDFHAGTQRRAPGWMQKVGLEWFWRFALQPRRMFRRYFVDSWLVFGAIAEDLQSGGGKIPVAIPDMYNR
ncbi:MAG TPA: WecB/TagA/CpsF family glycosyltransferase [Bosea sp. (in: a-proteobacteria)]